MATTQTATSARRSPAQTFAAYQKAQKEIDGGMATARALRKHHLSESAYYRYKNSGGTGATQATGGQAKTMKRPAMDATHASHPRGAQTWPGMPRMPELMQVNDTLHKLAHFNQAFSAFWQALQDGPKDATHRMRSSAASAGASPPTMANQNQPRPQTMRGYISRGARSTARSRGRRPA